MPEPTYSYATGAGAAGDFGAPPAGVLHNRLVDADRGIHRVVVYAAGSRGLANFVRPLGLTVFKLGVTSAGDAQRRIVDLRRKQYASLFGRPGAPIGDMHIIQQAEEWALVPIRADHLGPAALLPSGFHLENGALEVEIRLDVPVEAVDRAVHAMMAPRALDRFLASVEGKKRLAAAGFDPAGVLQTKYALMFEEDRVSRVQELYLFKPQRELSRLVHILAEVLRPLMPARQIENMQGRA